MHLPFAYVITCLFTGIVIIVLLTAKYKVHPFFALMLSCFVVGLGVQLSFAEVLATIKEGFGNILKSLGFIIVLGTTLGILLEHTGSTRVLANYILKKVGERHAALAMSITGFIVGLPIFCDSGYIVLNGLNLSLAKRTGISIAVMAVALATGLYSVHCLIPPHPGATAAGSLLGVDFGKFILTGIVVAIPALIVGYLWAIYAGKKFPASSSEQNMMQDKEPGTTQYPSVVQSFLPIAIPILLIALRSFLITGTAGENMFLQVLEVLGDPVIALSIGILLAINGKRSWNRNMLGKLLQEGAEKAGSILVIIGAGGAFGAVLAAINIGRQFSETLPLASIGILFPFLITFLLKTAQGSSTVAIITAASIIHPLLGVLGLDSETGKLLAVLSMGAGSMMISHANDAYFWVIAKFAGLEMKAMLQVYTVATIWMGLVSMAMIYILSLVL